MKTVGVVRFPGTNCDRDVVQWVEAKGYKASAEEPKGATWKYLWHLNRTESLDFEAMIIPGGFSYGDYLRCGALAARSPVMDSVREFAKKGGPILGICNGFQVLVESGLLPGALVRNQKLRFVDDWVEMDVVEKRGFWSRNIKNPKVKLPVAHGEGRYYAQADELKKLEDKKQVWLKYTTYNPNGSLNNIAGITNEAGNVAGLMPHPERAIFDWMGSQDGMSFL